MRYDKAESNKMNDIIDSMLNAEALFVDTKLVPVLDKRYQSSASRLQESTCFVKHMNIYKQLRKLPSFDKRYDPENSLQVTDAAVLKVLYKNGFLDDVVASQKELVAKYDTLITSKTELISALKTIFSVKFYMLRSYTQIFDIDRYEKKIKKSNPKWDMLFNSIHSYKNWRMTMMELADFITSQIGQYFPNELKNDFINVVGDIQSEKYEFWMDLAYAIQYEGKQMDQLMATNTSESQLIEDLLDVGFAMGSQANEMGATELPIYDYNACFEKIKSICGSTEPNKPPPDRVKRSSLTDSESMIIGMAHQINPNNMTSNMSDIESIIKVTKTVFDANGDYWARCVKTHNNSQAYRLDNLVTMLCTLTTDRYPPSDHIQKMKKCISTDETINKHIETLSSFKKEAYIFINNAYSNLYMNLVNYIKTIWINDQFFEDNLLAINIYYQDLSVEIYTQDKPYNFLSLMCDVGGTLGLFLGASLMTIAEILEFFIFKPLLYRHSKKKETQPNNLYDMPIAPLSNYSKKPSHIYNLSSSQLEDSLQNKNSSVQETARSYGPPSYERPMSEFVSPPNVTYN